MVKNNAANSSIDINGYTWYTCIHKLEDLPFYTIPVIVSDMV